MPPTAKRKHRKKQQQKNTKKNQRGGFNMSEFLNKNINFGNLRRNVASRFGYVNKQQPMTLTEYVPSVINTNSIGNLGGTRKRSQKIKKKLIITR
jgi:hypothetical protein